MPVRRMPSPARLKRLLLHMSLVLFTLSAMVGLLASVLFLLSPTSSQPLPGATALQRVLPPFLQPGQSSWHPPTNAVKNTSACSDDGEWDILYHLGGNGPWIENKLEARVGGVHVPDGCVLDMAHLMSRHGERYPTKTAGKLMLDFVGRVKSNGLQLKGILEFLNEWEYFTDTPDAHFEELTTTGPYAGILEAFTTGVKLSTRYTHLKGKITNAKTLLWATDSSRVIETAKYFAAGFFGLESKLVEVVVIPKDETRGADVLSPGSNCLKYREDDVAGRILGYEMRDKYCATYLGDIAKRLAVENPGWNFTDQEVWSMQEMCGFETTVRGHSPWCAVFTELEWSSFEYARDIIHFYRAGPGNKYARAMGWLWLNATTTLLLEGPESAGPLYFSFVHDGDMVSMLAALGLFEDPYDLPIDHIVPERNWKTSQITPMGGRILLERLTCASSPYIRFNVNDGIMPLPGCSDGPGGSCAMAEFAALVMKSGEAAGDFKEMCGLGDEAPSALTFLRQPAFPDK